MSDNDAPGSCETSNDNMGGQSLRGAHRKGGGVWGLLGVLGPKKHRALLYETIPLRLQRVLVHPRSISSIPDYLIFPGLTGPSRIQNQFNYHLILARKTLGSQEIRVYALPRGKWNPRIVLAIGR